MTEPLTIHDVAAANVSHQTVSRVLRHPSSPSRTVGIVHLDRFSGAVGEAFGELPADSLRAANMQKS